MMDIKEMYEVGESIEITGMNYNLEYMIGQQGYIQAIYNDHLYVMIPHCGYFNLKYDQVKKIKKIKSKNYDMVELEDNINHPKHYTDHPSGIECIQITEHMNFCLGNAIKYIWRAGLKNKKKKVEDLQKAKWYIEREIERSSK